MTPSLVERLQIAAEGLDCESVGAGDACREAADALEALTRERDEAQKAKDFLDRIYGGYDATVVKGASYDAACRMIEDATISGGDMIEPTVNDDKLASMFATVISASEQRLQAAEAKLLTIQGNGPDFTIGQQVEKFTGDYVLPGEVRGAFTLYDGGPWRYNVLHEAVGGGFFCHIYSAANIRSLNIEDTVHAG